MAGERSGAEERLRVIVEGLASKTGRAFFRSLVRHLAAALGVRYVLVAETKLQEADVMRSLAVWTDDAYGEDFEYALGGTPCEGVVDQATCFYASGVQRLFPRDELLVRMGVESYLGTPMFDTSGRPLGLLVAMHDRPMEDDRHARDLLELFASYAGTELERMRVEEALRESEQRTRLIVDTTLDAVITIDARSIVTGWNARAIEIFGWSESEALGRDLAELIIPAELRSSHRAGLERFLATGEGSLLGRRIEIEGLHRSGTRLPVELSIATLRTEESYEFSAFVQDISERRRAEEERASLETQLQLAQKLESLGILAGGIAHDFNNLLTGILANAGVVRRELPADHPAQRQLAEVIQGSKVASRLTTQLLDYAGRGQIQSRPLDLAAVLRAQEPLLHTSVRGRARLQIEIDEGLPTVEADPVQIQQVLMNLVINAAESGEDVKIEIRVQRLELGGRDVARLVPGSSLGPGDCVALDVADDGCGLDRATQARIFDPFFTTKATGRGLGLAATLGIVNHHGGGIQLHSNAGVGTRFRVLFPASDKPAEALPERSAEELAGEGVVLVIDDDEFVLRAASAVLESFGYSVVLAEDGMTGVARFRERPGEIDLVVLDLHMPGMSGEETFAALRAIRPDVRVVLSTGFDSDQVAERLGGGESVAYLGKPYEPEALASAVQRMLGTGRETPGDFDSELAALKAQYRDKLPARLKEIEGAVRSARELAEPMDALREAWQKVHTLKGTAGSYGFADASAALQDLDAALQEVIEPGAARAEAWDGVEDALGRVLEIGARLRGSAAE